ncbi:MAG: DUF4007 family protein [Pseudomonadales bacterium]
MAVLFHGNFALNRKHLAGILQRALKKSKLKDKDLAKSFGYGAPFAARQRSWLHKTGLCELGLPLQLTPVGEVVLEHDPDLESPTTQWVLHHELVEDPERAEAWHFFAKEFLPKHSTFTKDDLLDGLAKKLGPHSMKHFGPGSKLNQQIARKIIQAYTETAGLGDLNLVRVDGPTLNRSNVKQMGPWKTPALLRESYTS